MNRINPRDHVKDAEEERRKPQARMPTGILCRPLREPPMRSVKAQREALEST